MLRIFPQYILLLFVFIFSSNQLFAQLDNYDFADRIKMENHIYNPDIHTVLLYRQSIDLAPPMLELNTSQKLILRFDDWSNVIRDYMYTVIHCDADWTPSGLMQMDYLTGFNEVFINNFRYSFNTTVPYINYEISFPNDDLDITRSGNYIVVVYDAENKEDIILTQRFVVFEQVAGIFPKLHQGTLARDRLTKHEIDLKITYDDLYVPNPYSDIKIVMQQNDRWDNCITGIQPTFFRDKVLEYDYETEVCFDGGNEFRLFDLKSVRFLGQHLRRISFVDSIYRVRLHNDGIRSKDVYTFNFDLDGQRLIGIQERNNDHTEADYAKVKFTLVSPFPFRGGDVYVFGALSYWQTNESNKMEYDERRGVYETEMWLKQGYYNYAYAFVKDDETKADLTLVEGNYYQTTNNYTIYCYLRDYTLQYDRLVGVKKVSTSDMF
mgnify:CR=1 FL=1